ncbi:MAG: hypothetical protein ACR2PL_12185, partial [Dehalococcoidia bacterium]
VQYTPPSLSEEFTAQQADMDRGAEIMRLLNVYVSNPSRRPADLSNLGDDLRLAIEVRARPPTLGQAFFPDVLAAVAATALIAFVDGRFQGRREDLDWAISIVLDASLHTPDGETDDPGVFDMGHDRSAALAVPCLLLPRFNEDNPSWLAEEDRNVIRDALLKLMTSGTGEVRRRAVMALGRVWDAPCTTGGEGSSPCRHVVAYEAVEASARDCRMGPFDLLAQRRPLLPIEGVLASALDEVKAEDLLVSRLTVPLVAACRCASSGCCVSQEALALRDVLLRAHARGAVYWMRTSHQLDTNPEVQEMLAECFLNSARDGDLEVLQKYVEAVIEETEALWPLLHELARAATYEAGLRATLRRIWPVLMTTVLDAIDAERLPVDRQGRRHHRDHSEIISALLPRPQFSSSDRDPEATLVRATGDWIDIQMLAPLISRWLPLAVGLPTAVDSLIGLIKTGPLSFQARQGFDWVIEVIGKRVDTVAKRTFLLVDWLDLLRIAGVLDKSRQTQYQALIDVLAAHGDRDALRVQKLIE